MHLLKSEATFADFQFPLSELDSTLAHDLLVQLSSECLSFAADCSCEHIQEAGQAHLPHTLLEVESELSQVEKLRPGELLVVAHRDELQVQRLDSSSEESIDGARTAGF